MGAAGDRSADLRAVLRELAAADAPELLAQARLGAHARVKALFEDALVDELVRAASRLHEHPLRNAAMPPSAAAPVGGDAWWVYCVLSTDAGAAVAAQATGIEPGSSVEVIAEGGIAALVTRVPRAEYDDERLREHLEDIEWVERIARAHEAVLEHALAHTTIVPLRLCTLYRDPHGVRRLLREQREALAASLAAVDGATEWGLKLFAVPREAQSASGVQANDSPSRAASGADAGSEPTGAMYLARRQREREVADRAEELRVRCAEDVHERLSEIAREARVNPVQRPEAHGRDAHMLLNAAYLLERDRSDQLHATVSELRGQWEPHGFLIELTGPWPPYNFVSEPAGVMP